MSKSSRVSSAFLRFFTRWVRGSLLIFCTVALAITLTGCLPETPSPTPLLPTPTVTQTPTGTATIVWFPPTKTFTPAPTRYVSPTTDPRPAVGAALLEDPFTDQKSWFTGRTAIGSIAYGKGELTLAVSTARGALLSLRKTPSLGNFYLTVDALPSLCRDEDSYGLLLRASSNQDYYRLALTCSGRLRLERLKGAKIVVLQDWVSCGQIPPGGMMRSQVGVFAQGQELRIFINGEYQFSVRDPVWESGMLGVFARSSGETPLTVSFSNLVVYTVGSGRILSSPTPAPKTKATPTRKPSATAAAKP